MNVTVNNRFKALRAGVALVLAVVLLVGIFPVAWLSVDNEVQAANEKYDGTHIYLDFSSVTYPLNLLEWENYEIVGKVYKMNGVNGATSGWNGTEFKMTKVANTDVYKSETTFASDYDFGNMLLVFYLRRPNQTTDWTFINGGDFRRTVDFNCGTKSSTNRPAGAVFKITGKNSSQINSKEVFALSRTSAGTGEIPTSTRSTANGDNSRDIKNGTLTKKTDGTRLYIKSDFYDYYSDLELYGDKRDDTTFVTTKGYDYTNSRYVQAFKFDKALSSYYQTNMVTNPLYFGHFQWRNSSAGTLFSHLNSTGELYGTGLKAIFSSSDVNGTNEYDATYRNFFYNNNSQFRSNCNECKQASGEESHNHNANVATQGLYSDNLSETDGTGKLMLNKSGGSVEAPFFSKSFLRNNGVNYGYVYEDVEFPFFKVVENGDEYWEIKSSDSKETLRMTQDTGTGGWYLDEVGADKAVYGFTDGKLTSSPNFFPFNDGDTLKTSCGDNAQYYCDRLNYGFGFSMTIPFEIEDHATVDGTEDGTHISFRFSGDDDMVVYLDGKLVLDIGGGHGAVTGDIDFETQEAIVSAVKNDSGQDYDVKTDFNYTAENPKAGKHNLQIFYMERGIWESNLYIKFNLPVNPNKNVLEVQEETTFDKVNEGLKAITKKAADRDIFNYTIANAGTDTDQISNSNIVFPTYENISRVNSQAENYSGATPPTTVLTSDRGLKHTESEDEKYYFYLRGTNNVTWYRAAALFKDSETGEEEWVDEMEVWNSSNSDFRVQVPKKANGDYYTTVIIYAMKSGTTGHESSDQISSGNGKNTGEQTIPLNKDGTKMGIRWKQSGGYYTPESASYFNIDATTEAVAYVAATEDIWYSWPTFGYTFTGGQTSTKLSNVPYELTDPFATDGKSLTGITGTGGTDGQFNLFYGQTSLFRGQFAKDSTMSVTQNTKVYSASTQYDADPLGTEISADGEIPTTFYKHNAVINNNRNVSSFYDTSVTAIDMNNYDDENEVFQTLAEYSSPQSTGQDYEYKNTSASAGENDPIHIKEIFTNAVKVGDISLTKTIDKSYEYSAALSQPTKGFKFQLKLTNVFGVSGVNADDTNYDFSEVTIERTGTGDTTLTEQGYFYIKLNETVTIKNIPVGTDYEFVEVDEYYTPKSGVNTENLTGRVVESNTIAGKAENTRRLGDLEITKTITGAGANTSLEFPVTVTLTAPTGVKLKDYFTGIEGQYTQSNISALDFGTITDAGATITFKVTNGSSLKLLNLPYGTRYTVEENTSDPSLADYTPVKVGTDSNGKNNYIVDADNEKVAIENKYKMEVFTLRIYKKWSGLEPGTTVPEDYRTVYFYLQRWTDSNTTKTQVTEDNDNVGIGVEKWTAHDIAVTFTSTDVADSSGNIYGFVEIVNLPVYDSSGDRYYYRALEYAPDSSTKLYSSNKFGTDYDVTYTESGGNSVQGTKGATVLWGATNTKNPPYEKPITMPSTGGDGTIWLLPIGITAIALAGAALMIYKKRLQPVAIKTDENGGVARR